MLKNKTKSVKCKAKSYSLKLKTIKVLSFALWFCALHFVLCAYSFAQGEFKYDNKGRRNPFIPLVTSGGRLLNLDQQEGLKALSLEGIIYDKDGQSYAIVNGRVVGIGDEVGEYRVLRIEEERVIFIKAGELLEIEMTGGGSNEEK
jgi:hypothetical protein